MQLHPPQKFGSATNNVIRKLFCITRSHTQYDLTGYRNHSKIAFTECDLTPMPYLPYTDLDGTSNQFPGTGPASTLANRATQAVCATLGAIGDYTRAAYSYLGVPEGAASFFSASGIFDRLCQPYTRTDPIPPMPGIGDWVTNCKTQGSITWRVAQNWGTPSLTWVNGSVSWNCTGNRGIPLSGPTWYPSVGFDPGYYKYVFSNSSGTGTQEVIIAASNRNNPPASVQILTFTCAYCPECNLVPPPQPVPIPPVQLGDVNIQVAPQITINIDFPRGWGLPPLTFPVIFSPVIVAPGAIAVRPTLTLAPRIDLNPDFAFAPTFEFNLGGISIGGGGHSEPEQDIEDLCSCECPDPPPGDEVDYPRIQRIVSAVASTFRELPGEAAAFVSGPWIEGEFIELAIASGGRYIRYEFNLENYTGGATFGENDVPNVIYPGWLTFGIDDAAAKGSERIFLNYQSGFIPIPPWSRVCYIHTQAGAVAKARVESLQPLGTVE